MPKFSLRPLLGVVLLLSAGCSTLIPPGENVTQVAFSGAPQIKIISPEPNARYREGSDVYIVARVDNAGPDVGNMEIRIGNEMIAQQTKPDKNGSSSFAINVKWPATRSGKQTVSVFVQRTDLSISDQKTVDIDVIGAPTPTVAPTVETLPTADLTVPDNAVPNNPAPPTDAPQAIVPTSEPPTQAPPPTASVPQVKVKSGANVRRGPSTSFDPPLGSMAAAQTAEILAKNGDASWFKIKIYNSEGWISASTVDVEGSITNIPVEVGPPTPVPPAPTAIPATAGPTVPATGPDLIIDGTPRISPHPFTCGQGSEIVVKVKNIGSAASAGTEVLIQDLFSGQPGASTKTTIGALQPGQSADTGTAVLTVSTNYGQLHTIRVTVDGNANNTEMNEGNNQFQGADYTLQQGACP